jgi:hypothetical protein
MNRHLRRADSYHPHARGASFRARARYATVAPVPRSSRASGSMMMMLWLVALVLLFEEWFWAESTRAIARLSSLARLSAVEPWIRRRAPAQALMLFVVPILVIYPFKAVALVAIARGDLALGGAAFVAAKLAATAVFARLYELTEPAILHFGWVRVAKTRFLAVRAYLHAWLNARPAYRRARALIRGHSARLAHRYRVACRLQGRRRNTRMDTSA